MHYKRVIPCLDVDRGRVVKGIGFLDLRDAGDPVELACRYDRAGADERPYAHRAKKHASRSRIA